MDPNARTKKNRGTAMGIGWLGLACLAGSLLATGSWAGESVKISELLAHPESYNMKVVTVAGIVRNHRLDHFIGNVTGLEKCYQYFTVADESGAVKASYESICKMGNQEVVMLEDGDRVTVEAHFSGAPGAEGLLTVRSVTKH
jgi:hypothetical protein